jgi:hypothetical protein
MAAPQKKKIAKACCVCKREFRSEKHPDNPPRHCTNGACSWCYQCVETKNAQARGR